MNVGQKFLVEKGYPMWTKVLSNLYTRYNKATFFQLEFVYQQVLRVVDGGEPTLFKQYFSSWKEKTVEAHHHIPIPKAIKTDQIAG